MHRQVSVLLVVLSGFFPVLAPADLSAQDVKDGPKDAGRGAFFKKSDIDFWGTGAKKKQADAATRKKTVGGFDKDLYETVFAEPVQMPDGRYAVYVPPRAVLEFLENPTKESARGYLDWQSTRSRKIATALELLEAVKREELDAGIEKESGGTDEKTDRRAQDKSRTRSTRETALSEKKTKTQIRLTYFRQTG